MSDTSYPFSIWGAIVATNKEPVVASLHQVIWALDHLGNTGLVEGHLEDPSLSKPSVFFITGTFLEGEIGGSNRFVCVLDPEKEGSPWREMIETDIRFITDNGETLSPAALFKYLPLLKSKYPSAKIRELYFDPVTGLVVTPSTYH